MLQAITKGAVKIYQGRKIFFHGYPGSGSGRMEVAEQAG
jgi:hypothetical protein